MVDPAIPDGDPVVPGVDTLKCESDPVMPIAGAPMTARACAPRVPGGVVPSRELFGVSTTVLSSSETLIMYQSVSAKLPRLSEEGGVPDPRVCPRYSLREIEQRGRGELVARNLEGAFGEAALGGWSRYRTGGHAVLYIWYDPSRSRRCDPGRNVIRDPWEIL